MIENLPILGICGFSGSGKTTLIEKIIPWFVQRGLRLAVVKHDVHGIQVDTPGKDSDRFFRAGADVLLQGKAEEFFRVHRSGDRSLTAQLQSLASEYDFVIVEGHKGTPLRKVWMLSEGESAPPEEIGNLVEVFPRDADRVGAVTSILENYLEEQWHKTPMFGCVLIGGKSSRMGTPKHLIETDGKTWLERTVQLLDSYCRTIVIGGSGAIPESLSERVRLADVGDARGPMSGLLAAARWAPGASWLVTACDLPDLTAPALEWLISTRAPGTWATMPKLEKGGFVEPLLAHYDFRVGRLLEELSAQGNYKLTDLAGFQQVSTPDVPSNLTNAWRNVNTPTDLNGD